MPRTLTVVVAVMAALAIVPTAALAVTANTIRISVSSGGVEANQISFLKGTSATSGTGRFVAFQSAATNLVAGDTNGVSDIFVHDRKTGETRRVSVSSSGAEANGSSLASAISANGRYVAFLSDATNLVAGDTNGVSDIFVRDRSAGTTRRVSVSSAGLEANGASSTPSISADGDHIVFESIATNLVAGDSNGQQDIFVRDRSSRKTRRVSISSAGTQANGFSAEPSISSDGNVVAFYSGASTLVSGDSNGLWDVFIRIRTAGKTRRVSVSSAGAQGNGVSLDPAIAANGRFVAFTSVATNLVGGDSNVSADIFVRDRKTGETRRVSVSSAGVQGDNSSNTPTISADGRYVAFRSLATNLVAGDTNGADDVFVRDRSAGRTRRVSVAFDGAQANGDSLSAKIAGSGRFVAFSSLATNLIGNDFNALQDVFLRGPLF
jgi:Tol biopolymer transport system component